MRPQSLSLVWLPTQPTKAIMNMPIDVSTTESEKLEQVAIGHPLYGLSLFPMRRKK